jgi:hypothetical protein
MRDTALPQLYCQKDWKRDLRLIRVLQQLTVSMAMAMAMVVVMVVVVRRSRHQGPTTTNLR